MPHWPKPSTAYLLADTTEGRANLAEIRKQEARNAGKILAALESFTPLPDLRLPFPSMVVASENDPYATFEEAAKMASTWGGEFGMPVCLAISIPPPDTGRGRKDSGFCSNASQTGAPRAHWAP